MCRIFNFLVVKCLMNMKKFQRRIAKFSQVLEILNNTFKPTLV